jgi:1-acyl-sn-glycerol-3-phosphate acyltransferase
VDRSRPHGLVEGIVAVFGRAGPLWVAITPEGTRTRVTRFKTGFFRIALAAEVPILPVVINYRRRAFIPLPVWMPHSAVERGVAEMEKLFAHHGARRN